MDYTCGQGVFVIPDYMPKQPKKVPPPIKAPDLQKPKKSTPYRRNKNPTPVIIDIEAEERKALLAYKTRVFGRRTNLPNFDTYQISSSDAIFMTTSINNITGEFRSGKLNGPGIAFYGKYAFYEGGFLDGLKSGSGRMTYIDSDHDVS